VSHTCPRIEPRSFTLRPHRETVAAREIRLSGVPRGAVVVLWDGSSLGDADDVLNGLAEHGYESLAADLSGPMQALDDRMGLADAALRHLGANGWEHEQVGIVGYGPGGWLSLQAAAAFRLGAAVSVAPVLPAGHADATAHALTRLRTPWLDDRGTRRRRRRVFGAAISSGSCRGAHRSGLLPRRATAVLPRQRRRPHSRGGLRQLATHNRVAERARSAPAHGQGSGLARCSAAACRDAMTGAAADSVRRNPRVPAHRMRETVV